jgi:hypothetical protein
LQDHLVASTVRSMTATFVCPYCSASYPRKPVLVGRAVRCTTCKNAFRLREDGIADKIEMAEAAPAQPPAPSVAAPAPIQPPAPIPTSVPKESRESAAPAALAAPPAQAAPGKPKLPSTGWGLNLDVEVDQPDAPAAPSAPASIPTRSPPATIKSPLPDGTATTRKSERMNAQQMEARRAMAATLATSMSEALKSEAVKREVQGEKAKAKAEGQVGKIGPAVLTNQGVEEAKSRRALWLGFVGALVIGAGLYWLLFSSSPQRAALEAYTAEVDSDRVRAGKRIQSIQERAWLITLPPADIGVPPMVDMRDARIGATRTITLTKAKDLIVSIKGLVPVEPGPVWIAPDRIAAVDDLRRPEQKESAFIAAVLKKEKKAVSHPALLEALVKTGMTEEDARVVDLFLRGRTDAKGNNTIAKRWLDGDIPATLQITRFAGTRGSLLLARGATFKTQDVEYEGRIARFVSPGWPSEWKVLTIDTKLKPKF